MMKGEKKGRRSVNQPREVFNAVVYAWQRKREQQRVPFLSLSLTFYLALSFSLENMRECLRELLEARVLKKTSWWKSKTKKYVHKLRRKKKGYRKREKEIRITVWVPEFSKRRLKRANEDVTEKDLWNIHFYSVKAWKIDASTTLVSWKKEIFIYIF